MWPLKWEKLFLNKKEKYLRIYGYRFWSLSVGVLFICNSSQKPYQGTVYMKEKNVLITVVAEIIKCKC